MTLRGAMLRVVAALAVALTLACSTTLPQKEIADAQAAIDSARAAGVDRYAPAELAAAADSLARAKTAVGQRDFRLALSEALDARARAQDAVRAAAAKEADLRTEADEAVTAVAASADRLRDALAAAESARPPNPNRNAVSDARRAIVVANVALQEARAALARGDPSQALAACGGVVDRLNGAMTALTAPARPPAGERRR